MASETTTTILLEGKEGEFYVAVTAEVEQGETIENICYYFTDDEETQDIDGLEETTAAALSKLCIQKSAIQIEALAVYALREQAASDYGAHYESQFED
jgi:hypothetical protein